MCLCLLLAANSSAYYKVNAYIDQMFICVDII